MATAANSERFETALIGRTDYLAAVRTELANQRTGLAYARTAIMLLATGLTFIKLFAVDHAMVTLGFVLLPLAALSIAAGVWSFTASARHIANPYPRSGSPNGRIKRFVEKIEDASAAAAMAEGGDRASAVSIMRHGWATVAIIGDRTRMEETLRRAAAIVAQGTGELVIWVRQGISLREVRNAAIENCDPSIGWRIKSVPEEEKADILIHRLWRRPLRAVVIDEWVENRWMAGSLGRHAEDLPIVVVDAPDGGEVEFS